MTMLKRLLILLGVAVGAGAAAHYASLHAMPTIIMDRATDLLKGLGVEENEWFLARRVTPQEQPIVRASTDLSYSVCLLNLDETPVRVSAPRWPDYGSISVFQRDTENVFVGSLKGTGELEFIVAQQEQQPPVGEDIPVVYIASDRGVALIRRLAPTQEQYDSAALLMEHSVCAEIQ